MAEATAPVKRGIVTSFARPGGNITGLARRAPEEFGKYLELLKETVPGLTRVAVLWNAKGPASKIGWESVRHPAQKLGLQLHSMEVRSTGDLKRAFREAREAGVEALYVTPGQHDRRGLVAPRPVQTLLLKNRLAWRRNPPNP